MKPTPRTYKRARASAGLRLVECADLAESIDIAVECRTPQSISSRCGDGLRFAIF
jgi:hypothetical protein